MQNCSNLSPSLQTVLGACHEPDVTQTSIGRPKQEIIVSFRKTTIRQGIQRKQVDRHTCIPMILALVVFQTLIISSDILTNKT